MTSHRHRMRQERPLERDGTQHYMIGTVLANRYTIVRELGRGGMGVVYLARDELLEREVAVKLLAAHAMSPEAEERFRREARVVARMDHPGIVPLHDFVRHGDSVFLVMPFVQGASLRRALAERSLSIDDVLEVGVRVADALDYSHRLGVVHRDVKPENIMVERDADGTLRVRVADFGIAAAEFEERVTKDGVIVGTGAYLSPEQISEGDVDARTDVYALGVVLYECLAGHPPFAGTGTGLYYRITFSSPRSLASQRDGVDAVLDRIVLWCLEKLPARRPATARHLADALRDYRAAREAPAGATRSAPDLAATAPPAATRSPFVGRDRERDDLVARLGLAASGESQFVVVAGETGIGKSRLLDELEAAARRRDVRVLHGRFLDSDRSFPYQGFNDVIQEHVLAATVDGSEPSDELADLWPELVELFPSLGEIPSMRTTRTSGVTASTGAARQAFAEPTAVYELLARALVRICAGRPLVLLLEDLHASDVSVEALQYVVRRLSATPTLFVATYRTGETDRSHPLARFLDAFRGDRRFLSMRLGPLGRAHQDEMVRALVGAPEVDETFLARLFEITEGNPYFTIELVRSLVDAGTAHPRADGTWALTSEITAVSGALPETIQQAVGERLARLGEAEREVLATASALGRAFAFEDLEALAGERDDLDEAVDWLVEAGFFVEEREARGDRLAFANAIVRDVLYAGLSRRRRRALHRAMVTRLERRHGANPDQALPDLVHHAASADVHEKAVGYALQLARRSLEAFSHETALRAAETALEHLERADVPGDALEAEARLRLAAARRGLGDAAGALDELDRAALAAGRAGEIALGVEAASTAAETAWDARFVDRAAHWVERGLAAAPEASPAEFRARLLAVGATLANLRGEFARAERYLADYDRLRGPIDTREADVDRSATLAVGLPAAIESTHPINLGTRAEQEVFACVVETLIRTDSTGVLVPHLAERWEMDADARRCRLWIRPGVLAHDGRAVGAVEVKRAFEDALRRSTRATPAALRDVAGVAAFRDGHADAIAGLTVDDDGALEVRFEVPLPIFPALLTDTRTAVTLSGPGEDLVGTGPFSIGSFEPNRVHLVRNPQPWRGAPARVAAIKFLGRLTAQDLAAGIQSGTLDLVRGVPTEEIGELLGERRRYRLAETLGANVCFILFNTARPAVADHEVRAALAALTRFRDLVRARLGRLAEPAEGLLPPTVLGHDANRRRSTVSQDVAAAAVAARAPLRLRAAITQGIRGRHAALVDALVAEWSAHGVSVDLVEPNGLAYLDDAEFVAGVDLLINGWSADYADPDAFTGALFHSQTGTFRHYVRSGELDACFEEARRTTDAPERERLYRSIDGALLADASIVPLFHEVEYRLATRRVASLAVSSAPPFVNYADVAKAVAATPSRRATGGGILHIPFPVGNELAELDPALVRRDHDTEVVAAVFETLTRHAKGARVVPWLASEVEPSDGGRRFRFRLREDVVFHNGRTLTARDVRYSLERLLQCERSSYRWQLTPIRGARALAEGTRDELEGFRIESRREFTIELEQPVAFFPSLLSHPATAIVPEGASGFAGTWREGVAGTGPFRIASFEPALRLELEASPSYWRPGYPKCDGLAIQFGLGPAETYAEFRANRASLAWNLYADDEADLRRAPEFAAGYREAPLLQTVLLAFNVRRGPLADEAVRHHIVRSLDVEELVDRAGGRLAAPTRSMIPPGLLGHDASRWTTGQSLGGRPFASEIEVSCLMRPLFGAGSLGPFRAALFDALAALGVRATVLQADGAAWDEARAAGDADMFLLGWTADYPDADTFAHGLLHATKGWIGPFCGIPEIDRLVERGRVATDPDLRHDLYREVEDLVARRALLLPLFNARMGRFARPEVRGLEISFAPPFVAYEDLWIER